MAQPPASVRGRLLNVLDTHGLRARLGESLFPIGNWHQSLSDRHPFTPENVETLKRVGDCVRATQFSMTLNRLTSSGDERNGIHWAFRTRGKPSGLQVLIQSIHSEMLNSGINDDPGHSGHITVSYRAPTAIATLKIEPIDWQVDDFLLVCGRGQPYRYDVLERWQLQAPLLLDPVQIDLLDYDRSSNSASQPRNSSTFDPNVIVRTLRAQILPDLLAVYAFGSRANGTAAPDSDLDLAVLTSGLVEPRQLWELSQLLANELNCAVDLLDLRAASTVMQYQVVTTGVRWWAKDSQAALYESVILSEKTRLEEARKGLMEDIQLTGSIYGG